MLREPLQRGMRCCDGNQEAWLQCVVQLTNVIGCCVLIADTCLSLARSLIIDVIDGSESASQLLSVWNEEDGAHFGLRKSQLGSKTAGKAT